MTRPFFPSVSIASATLAFLLVFAAPLFATTEYAEQTGKECGSCHVDAIGGGKLTADGARFLEDLETRGQYRRLSATRHIARLVIGYLHIMAAIIWFGTILYVHLMLKPAYASKGLPKGELRLGWLSMIVILASGVLLTIARMPDPAAFTTTRFGVLLTIKIALFLVMLTSALITTLYIGPRLRRKLRSPVAAVFSNELTLEQLAQFDGAEGRPAYFGYKGIVYDVTGSRAWRSGTHMVKHAAGHDLTDALKNAPHAEDKVLAMRQVGMLVTAGHLPERPFYERLFYFFAYMNLALVFVIVFVISLWRWW